MDKKGFVTLPILSGFKRYNSLFKIKPNFKARGTPDPVTTC